MPKKPPSDQAQFRVGDAMVYPDRLVISIHDEEHTIEPRVMEVLIALANAAAQGKDEALSAVDLYIRAWIGGILPAEHGIDGAQAENPVHKAITHLRKVFGDDPKSPRYIVTVRKKGYRLVARVVYQDHRQRIILRKKIWTGGSPYVGLNSFDSGHASVFIGRSRTTSELIKAMSRQMDQQRRLVLVVGASGCGKTSLLNAGAIPVVTENGGYAGLHALSVARCDLASTRPEDALNRLSEALMQWTLDKREIFSLQPVEVLAERLRAQPESVTETLEDAFQRHANRSTSALTHPHVLLVIDHAEALVADPSFGDDVHAEIDRFLHHLCESRHACVIMVVRGDFYLALAEALPGMIERKSGDGHIDVLTPRSGEIGEIIRIPAASAGLEFQKNPESNDYLDDVLLRASASQPDALPLLQHTLQMLYERRNENMQLCFDAYHEIGGLEGALAHHAEQVFKELPAGIQNKFDHLLSCIVAMQPEDDRISARRIPRCTLDNPGITFAEAFVQARLFVAEHESGNAHYRVAHEALLRRWPRAENWIRDNRRILLARSHLQQAAKRWNDEGRRDDHLLNFGRPLEEAMDVQARLADALSNAERDFILRSKHQLQRRKRTRKAAIIALAVMAITSTTMAFVAISMRGVAEHQETKSTNLTSFIIGEFSDRLDPTGNLALIESISTNTLRNCDGMMPRKTTTAIMISCSRASRKLGEVMMERGFTTLAFALLMQSKHYSDSAMHRSPSSMPALLESGHSAAWVGRHHWMQGEPALALLSWRSYDASVDQLRALSPLDHRYMMEASYAASNLAVLQRDLGLIDESRNSIHQSIALKTSATTTPRSNDEWQYELIVSKSILAGLLESDGKLRDADALYDALIDQLERLHRKHPAARDWERQLTSLQQYDAMLSLDLGNTAAARARIEDAITRLTRLGQAEPDNTSWQRLLAQAHLFASDVERIDGNQAASTRHLADAAACISHPMLASTVPGRIRAAVVFRSGLVDGNETRMTDGIEALDALRQRDGKDRHVRQALADALVLHAEYSFSQGDFPSARQDAIRSLHALDAFGADPHSVRILALRVRAQAILGSAPGADTAMTTLSDAGYRHPDLATARRRQPHHFHAGSTSH